MKKSPLPPGPAFIIRDIPPDSTNHQQYLDYILKWNRLGYKYQSATDHSPAGYIRPNGVLDKIKNG